MKKKPSVYERQAAAARRMALVEVSDPMTEAQAESMIAVLNEQELTQTEVEHMDLRPGMIFYDGWHGKLRALKLHHMDQLQDYYNKAR